MDTSPAARTAEVPRNIQNGIEAAGRLEHSEILGEVEYDVEGAKWLLHLRLSPPDIAFSDFVPFTTEWYVHIHPRYPFGEINFFPSRENGLTHTFPHQSLNRDGNKKKCRDGKLCLSDRFGVFRDHLLTDEPFTAEERLAWHVRRALSWLERASRNELLREGDFFELPDFPITRGKYSRVAFYETPETFERWSEIPDAFGYFQYGVSPVDSTIIVVKQMLKLNRKPLLGAQFGTYVTRSFANSKKLGIWLRVGSMPIVPPWQAPLTWRDLEGSLRQQGVDIRALMGRVFSTSKNDKRTANLLILGFPAPNRIGEEPERLHWLGIELPQMFFRDSNVRGFSSSTRTARLANFSLIRPDTDINWIASDNWGRDQIRTRGELPASLLNKRVLLIGAGALGSIVAETVVRGGLEDLVVCDGDDTEVGNLARHTLDLRNLGQKKAQALATHLNYLSPFARVRAWPHAFAPAPDALDVYDLVIDCSANQTVLCQLGSLETSRAIFFASFSFSFGARRLYSFVARGRQFPFDDYRNAIIPWMQRDALENEKESAPRESLGCWNPVFPARSEDILRWGSTAVKLLMDQIESENKNFKVMEYGEDEATGEVYEISDK